MALGAIQLNKMMTYVAQKTQSAANFVFTKNTDTFRCTKRFYADNNNFAQKLYADYERVSKGTRFENLVKIGEEENGVIGINAKEITILGKLVEGVSYPFFNMWLDIINATVSKITKKFPRHQGLNKITDLSLLKKRAKTVEAQNRYNELFGFKVFHQDPENRSINTSQYIHKQMTNNFSNYSSAQERALNRLLTGTVSALFVGNDFYNVSMYQTDNHSDAKKSGDKRFAQEMVRIGTSAFLTYSILSAFSKYTKNLAGTILTLVFAQTIPEFVSRLGASGMPLTPLSPEEAKNFEFKSAFGGLRNENKAANENVYYDKFIKTGYLDGGVNEFAQNIKNNANSQNVSFKAKDAELAKEKTQTPEKHPSFIEILFGTLATMVVGGISLAILKRKCPAIDNILQIMGREYEGAQEAISKKFIYMDDKELGSFIEKVKQSGNTKLAKDFESAIKKAKNSVGKNPYEGKPKVENFLLRHVFKGHSYEAEAMKTNMGRENTPWKCLTAPLDYALTFIKSPYKLTNSLINKLKGIDTKVKEMSETEKQKNTLGALRKMYEAIDKNSPDFAKELENNIRKTYNFETQKAYNPTDLAMFSRIFITVIGTYFFVNDFRNRILIDSKGQDIQRANEVTNERIGQKVFNLFTNTFWMSLFNNLFQATYLKSLLGAIAIAGGTEVVNESVLRFLIGVPIEKQESRADIEDFEEKAYTAPGPIGVWTRAFADATGKKPIGERAQT